MNQKTAYMRSAERRVRREELRRRRLRIRMIFGLICIIAVLLFARVVSSREAIVDATGTTSELRYKVVEIKSGDSLWSIAKDNYSDEFKDVYTYVHEIKKCNHIKGSRILPGYKLTIPYYN